MATTPGWILSARTAAITLARDQLRAAQATGGRDTRTLNGDLRQIWAIGVAEELVSPVDTAVARSGSPIAAAPRSWAAMRRAIAKLPQRTFESFILDAVEAADTATRQLLLDAGAARVQAHVASQTGDDSDDC